MAGGFLSTEALADAMGGAQGGLLGLYATMPIETIQKTQVALKGRGSANSSAAEVARKILQESGIFGFYRGIGVLSAMVASEKFIYYLLYTWMKRRIMSRSQSRDLSLAANIVIGYLADLGRLPVTMPLDLLATRMQTSTTGKLSEIVESVLRAKGITGFYEGWKAYTILAVKPAIQILVFEQVKQRLNRSRGLAQGASLPFKDAFLLGALSRMIATVLCYPFFFARITAQSGHKGGAFQVMKDIYRKNGISGLYAGLGPELMRGTMFHAVNMASMESLRAANLRALRKEDNSGSALNSEP